MLTSNEFYVYADKQWVLCKYWRMRQRITSMKLFKFFGPAEIAHFSSNRPHFMAIKSCEYQNFCWRTKIYYYIYFYNFPTFISMFFLISWMQSYNKKNKFIIFFQSFVLSALVSDRTFLLHIMFVPKILSVAFQTSNVSWSCVSCSFI